MIHASSLMPKISPKYQRDYKNMDYQNPRLIRDKENRKKRIKNFLIAIILIVVGGLIYFFLYSPLFWIERVEVSGLEKVKSENINRFIDDYRFGRDYYVFNRNNFWLFNKNKLKTIIFEHYYFEEFTIKKKLPNIILITLKEKESAINWLANNLCYHLDLTGLAIEYCEENNGYLTINDLQNQEIKIGESAIENKELQYIVGLYSQTKKITERKLDLIQIEKTENVLDLITKQGILLRFNSTLAVSEQVARLDTLLNQEEIKNNLEQMKYIDLRFGEKVYYK